MNQRDIEFISKKHNKQIKDKEKIVNSFFALAENLNLINRTNKNKEMLEYFNVITENETLKGLKLSKLSLEEMVDFKVNNIALIGEFKIEKVEKEIIKEKKVVEKKKIKESDEGVIKFKQGMSEIQRSMFESGQTEIDFEENTGYFLRLKKYKKDQPFISTQQVKSIREDKLKKILKNSLINNIETIYNLVCIEQGNSFITEPDCFSIFEIKELLRKIAFINTDK